MTGAMAGAMAPDMLTIFLVLCTAVHAPTHDWPASSSTDRAPEAGHPPREDAQPPPEDAHPPEMTPPAEVSFHPYGYPLVLEQAMRRLEHPDWESRAHLAMRVPTKP